MTKVSIVMPVYNGISFIEESIQSIKKQTFKDWEFLIVNELGSDDGSREVIEKHAAGDPRIKLIQNTERLGLAESLNRGIALAEGDYIARVDVDDPSYPQRLEKQTAYLDQHPAVTLCGAIQRSVTPTGSNVQWVSTDWEMLKASMLFGCEISHCAVMFRKSYFTGRNLVYDKEALSEDYDLWTKILYDTEIVNLPEVLVDHRWGFENISIQKGERLRDESRSISSRVLKQYFDIDIEEENLDRYLLSGWNSRPTEYAVQNREKFLKEGFRLLSLLREKNRELGRVDPKALEKVINRRWNWICESCEVRFDKKLEIEKEPVPQGQPLVSVVLPVYNSATYLRLAIDSIFAQTHKNWELLLINEYGSDDGSVEICRQYTQQDDRIHLIQNETRLGLGSSLNKGFLLAKGPYIARLDSDDLAHPSRFEKQVRYLETNQIVGICGSWQHHFGNTDWVHKPPEKPEQCKANLLFWCDLCHSTLMLRRSVVEEYQLYFNTDYMAEDYELWTRAIRVTQIGNIPEVLGEYRCGDNNITNSKRDLLRTESGHIVAEQLKHNLHIDIPEEKHYLFNGWGNIYTETGGSQKEVMLKELEELLLTIWASNKKIGFYDETALLRIINSKWRWAKFNENWHDLFNPYCIERVFDQHYRLPANVRIRRFLQENQGLGPRVKKIAKRILRPVAKPLLERIRK